MFNVNYFVVSQCNPYVLPLVSECPRVLGQLHCHHGSACCWLWTKQGCLAEAHGLGGRTCCPCLPPGSAPMNGLAAPHTRPPAALKRLVPRQLGNLVEGEFKHRWAAGRNECFLRPLRTAGMVCWATMEG